MLEVYQKRTFIEIDKNMWKFSAIFLNVVFKENAYYRIFPLKVKILIGVLWFSFAPYVKQSNNRRIGKIMDDNSYYTILRFSTYRTLLAGGLLI